MRAILTSALRPSSAMGRYQNVLSFPTGGDPYPFTMPTVKSMARSEVDNSTIMVVFEDGIVVYKSKDFGLSWSPTMPPGKQGQEVANSHHHPHPSPPSPPEPKPNFDDKDDVNVFWVGQPNPRYIDMQITKQHDNLPYCDNLDGCDNRRVVTARNSTDGVYVKCSPLARLLPNTTDNSTRNVCAFFFCFLEDYSRQSISAHWAFFLHQTYTYVFTASFETPRPPQQKRTWSDDYGLRVPDAEDPPELQVRRIAC